MYIEVTEPSPIDAVKTSITPLSYELFFYKGRKVVNSFIVTTFNNKDVELDKVMIRVDQKGIIAVESLTTRITPAADKDQPDNEDPATDEHNS